MNLTTSDFRLPRALSGICLLLLLTTTQAQEGLSPASSSRLTGVTLPAGAQYITDRALLSQINAQLKTFADELKSKCGETEVLGWTPDDTIKAAVQGTIQRLSSQLRSTGWL